MTPARSVAMPSPAVIDLPYRPDSAELFEMWADRPWSMFLDSGLPAGTAGRYDVLVTDPVATLVTHGAVTEIRDGATLVQSTDDPLRLLRETLARYAPPVDPRVASLPFAGGAAGYFGYDLGRRFEQLPDRAVDTEGLPTMAVGIYDCAIVVDHALRRCVQLGNRRIDAAVAQPRPPALHGIGPLQVSLARAEYAAAFERISEYIRAGDCYQVNLARRFSGQVTGDAWAGYRRLRALSPAPYGAYLNTPAAQILSNSPERFLRVRDGRIDTHPIKGTRPRHADAASDRRLAQELAASAKDRAENVMIVDLLRNDLGRVCEVGSVRVDALCRLESFATVHHLVSAVSGRLAPGVHALDALRACFPGGSITGAPKIRAMQIIDELERERRGVYCGAIGYVGFDGAMDLNIAIRTLVHRTGEARFWSGGGIVADSSADAEFQETLDKAAAMFGLLERSR